MSEPVRLVIWDLDDTFWRGTLAEGHITHIPESVSVVRELAARGIVSSLCSRNDLNKVREVLEARGLWDYFVFPSINWEPKGPRIRDLIEAIQLRPASVLFIDDNPSNLHEARHFSPEIQVAGVEIISGLLADPRLVGQPDASLTRLRRYRALEQRKTDQNSAGDADGFLRQSNIRVAFRHDLSGHLDRIVELINRTNQLNFIKRRLPDNPDAARVELSGQLRSHEVQAGLLHIVDRYGDHGDSGFYMLRNGNELLQFCFSCRIMGMGIELWLYRKLGRPQLKVSGEVTSDPVRDKRVIDWITVVDDKALAAAADPTAASALDWVAARGGCDLMALSHYFQVSSPDVTGEFNVGRLGFDARTDHSMFLRYAVDGLTPEAISEAGKIGYRPEDFRTSLTDARPGRGVIVLSFWIDVVYALYRHRRLGFELPFAVPGEADHSRDARLFPEEKLPDATRQGWVPRALEALRQDYDLVGTIDDDTFKHNLRVIVAAIPGDAPIVILQSNNRFQDPAVGVTHTSAAHTRFNWHIQEVAASFPRVHVINIRDVIEAEHEVLDWSHFDRIVYYRLYQRISQICSAP